MAGMPASALRAKSGFGEAIRYAVPVVPMDIRGIAISLTFWILCA